METYAVIIVSLMPAINAAVSCISASGDVDGFKQCAYKALGSGGASDSKSACNGNSGDAYNACMCAAASGIIKCYSDHCAGDAGLRNQIQDQASFCNVKATTAASVVATVAATLEPISLSAFSTNLALTTSIPTGSLVMPSATFSYPLTTGNSGVNLNNLPPFPNSEGYQEHIMDGLWISFLVLFI